MRTTSQLRKGSQSLTIDRHARRRIEAVIAGLIDALDHLDGDADREQTAIETAGAGFGWVYWATKERRATTASPTMPAVTTVCGLTPQRLSRLV